MVMLLCSMCAVCLAKLEQPKEDRWIILYPQRGNIETWGDVESIKYGNSTEAGHSGHKAVRVWTRSHFFKEQKRLLVLEEYDFDCATVRMLKAMMYDDKGKFLIGDDKEEKHGKPIAPNTVSEDYMLLFAKLGSLKSDANAYAAYVEGLKKRTRNYKATGERFGSCLL